MTRWSRALPICLLAFAGAPPAHAGTAPGVPCHGGQVRCLTVSVPLDRSGAVTGTVPLHVEVLPARGRPRGVIVLLAGGPGQAGLEIFRFGSTSTAAFFGAIVPGYTVVADDVRGTGRAGRRGGPRAGGWGACAEEIGLRRDFYGTADHAEDVEAIRRALGFAKVGLWGTSYGTRRALAYAVAHPEHVSRMLLDSAAPLREPDAFGGHRYSKLPGPLRRLCADNACRSATRSFAAEFAAVANALAAKPVTGSVRALGGRSRTVRLDQWRLLDLVFDTDLWRVGSELPAATHAAHEGDWRPLLRLVDLVSGRSSATGESINYPLFVATTCRDGPVPWTPDVPRAERRAAFALALARRPKSFWGPFGSWMGRSGIAATCLSWPSPRGGSKLGAKPLPDVPVLVLSGDLDTLTSVQDATTIASQFPHGRVLVAAGVGHAVLETDTSRCSRSAVRGWLAGRSAPGRCPRPQRLVVPPIPAFPPPSATDRPATAVETLHIAARTLREAEAAWQLLRATRQKIANGLTSGYLAVVDGRHASLLDYGLQPGVRITGRLGYVKEGGRYSFTASIDVSGSRAASGTLVLDHDTLAGTLGGVEVSTHTQGHVGG
jgi:pimeloyl-ACP methyl ester carboxylesterase